jgi:hypothetical protein
VVPVSGVGLGVSTIGRLSGGVTVWTPFFCGAIGIVSITWVVITGSWIGGTALVGFGLSGVTGFWGLKVSIMTTGPSDGVSVFGVAKVWWIRYQASPACIRAAIPAATKNDLGKRFAGTA